MMKYKRLTTFALIPVSLYALLFAACMLGGDIETLRQRAADANGENKPPDAGVPVTDVSLNQTTATVAIGATTTLTATVLPANATNKNVTWSSSAVTVATVTNGAVTGVGAGTATITVRTVDGGKTATCTVTVPAAGANVPVENVAITGGSAVVVGQTTQLTAVFTPANATDQTGEWDTTDAAKATVSQTGLVTGVAEGTAMITFISNDGAKVASHNINVVLTAVAVTGVSIAPDTLSLAGGATGQLTATITPPGATNTAVIWTSSADSVATVAGSGLTATVTAVAAGTATITVTTADGDFTAMSAVTVAPPKGAIQVEGETLVHYQPNFVGTGAFGPDLGTTNVDGSYTFDSTAGQYSGGGGVYILPAPEAGDTWNISDYQLITLYFEITGTTVASGLKSAVPGSNDIGQYPGETSTGYPDLAAGNLTITCAIAEMGTNTGIGFQRFSGGPVTVSVTKVVYSKATVHTISFSGGDYAGMEPIPDIKILDGRNPGFGGAYVMPLDPEWELHDFMGWKKADGTAFDPSLSVEADIALVADWILTPPRVITFDLNGGEISGGETTIPDITNHVNGESLGANYPEEPTRSGYEFDGWWSATYTEYFPDTPVNRNTDLKAKWVRPYVTGETYDVPLTGKTVWADLKATDLQGMWIPLDMPADFDIAPYTTFTVVVQRFRANGELVGPGYNARIAFTDADVEDLDVYEVKEIGTDGAKHGWWNIGIAGTGTNQPLGGANFGTADKEPTGPGGALVTVPIDYTPTAIAIIQDGTGAYQSLALVSLTFTAPVAPVSFELDLSEISSVSSSGLAGGLAAGTYNSGTLTFDFDAVVAGQRGLIPLSPAQILILQDPKYTQVTITIEGTDTAADPAATFRWHIGNPSANSEWSGTTPTIHPATGSLLSDVLTGTAGIIGRTAALLGHFILQKQNTETTTVEITKVTITAR